MGQILVSLIAQRRLLGGNVRANFWNIVGKKTHQQNYHNWTSAEWSFIKTPALPPSFISFIYRHTHTHTFILFSQCQNGNRTFRDFKTSTLKDRWPEAVMLTFYFDRTNEIPRVRCPFVGVWRLDLSTIKRRWRWWHETIENLLSECLILGL